MEGTRKEKRLTSSAPVRGSKERYEYEESLKAYCDWFSVMKTAEQRGHKKGFSKGLVKGRKVERKV